MRKYFWSLLMLGLISISGCSAQLAFIDPSTGDRYEGITGSTAGDSGDLTATIENETYKGEWIYSAMGGGYTIGTMNTSSYGGAGGYSSGIATFTGVSPAMSGNGFVSMKGGKGSYMKCVFTYSSWTANGIGSCKRNDGKDFDLIIKQ